MNPFHSLTDEQLAEWHRLTVRCEQLERDLAESRKATESVQAALIAEQSYSFKRLLTVYVLAVAQMRAAQREYDEYPDMLNGAAKREVEREVDELTRLHLTPSALQPGG